MHNRTILMCPPDYYNVTYAINPWMETTQKEAATKAVDPARARRQWESLKQVLEQEGFRIILLPPDPSCPDLVFTANAGLVHPERKEILLSNFMYAERQPEIPIFRHFFEEQGYIIRTVKHPQRQKFEGAGDALPQYYSSIPRSYFIGWGFFRTSNQGVEIARSFLGENYPTTMLRLADPNFYHLDTCFSPVGKRILYYPPAFMPLSRDKIKGAAGIYVIEASKTDAHNFVCNGIAVPPHNGSTHWKYITNCPSKEFVSLTASFDIETIAVELDEFIKAGGSAKCLTLMIHDT